MPSLSRHYQNSLEAEVRRYQNCVNVHSLPDIFHYWSNRHLLPLFRAYGASSPNDMFLEYLSKQFDANCAETRRFVSLGAGNCDLEVHLAQGLIGRGHQDFVFDCLELNAAMLERGREAARSAGVEDRLAFVQGDLNSWLPQQNYHAAMANQSLHHVVQLEHLYGEIRRSLLPRGTFVISDMIGRNGHLRWPEALDVVHELWRDLPPSYRFNAKSMCFEEMFADHDCSGEGFEGVRSQDILPLLLDRFHFQLFLPFANVIDPFVDRSFGPNFDPALTWDRAFIDRVHERDAAEIQSGRLKPTHMFAVVRKETTQPIFPDRLSPESCVRSRCASPNSCVPSFLQSDEPPYRWAEWPHRAEEQLQAACRMLVASAEVVRERTAWAENLERETAALSEELGEVKALAHRLANDLRAAQERLRHRTEWVAILQAEERRLNTELVDRTLWAQRLDAQLSEKTQWADRLCADLQEQTQLAVLLGQKLSLDPVRRLLRKAGRFLQRSIWRAEPVTGGRSEE